MKKYVVLGLLMGIAVSAVIVYLRRKDLGGTEFEAIFDSSDVADDLFGELEEPPDRP
jgi:hypothetical protein